MSQQTPYEQIRFINDAIKDRADKNQATFFSVKLERFGALTPLATKERGESFYETMIQYLTKYDMSAIVVELYNGKSYNIKEPFQTFKIIVKRSTEINGLGDSKTDELKITPTETVISTEKHFFSMAEKERQVMLLEFDNKRLQYELEELKKKNKKKKNYITELEAELGKQEKDKKNSLGNVSLGLVGANALESFAKSSFGIGILKSVFGMKQEALDGLLGSAETPTNTNTETKSTATLIPSTNTKEEVKQESTPAKTEDEKRREGIKKFINEFLDSADDATLRLYCELIQYLGSDTETLKSILEQVKSYRQRQQAIIKQNISKRNNGTSGLDNNPDEPDENDSS